VVVVAGRRHWIGRGDDGISERPTIPEPQRDDSQKRGTVRTKGSWFRDSAQTSITTGRLSRVF
jgi:hypothetical protein